MMASRSVVPRFLKLKRWLRGAFTLIEMVIVLMILGIVAAVAIPQYSSALDKFRADASAQRIAVDIKHARTRARQQSASQAIDYNDSTHQYALPGVADLRNPSAKYVVDLTAPPYYSKIASVRFDQDGRSNSEDATLQFNGFGIPDSSGTIVVQSGGCARTISVEALTGRVTVADQ